MRFHQAPMSRVFFVEDLAMPMTKEKQRIYGVEYRRKNKERIREAKRQYDACHREKARLRRLRWYRRNKKEQALYARHYSATHRQQRSARLRDWRKRNPERAREADRRARQKNQQKIAARQREYSRRPESRRKEAVRRRRWANSLTDSYVRTILAHELSLRRSEIPAVLLAPKRRQLRLHRISTQQKE